MAATTINILRPNQATVQAIIEKQLKKALLEKIKLEWPGCIDYYVFPKEDLAIIYLLPSLRPDTFHKMLLPKASAFVDFISPLKATFVDSEGASSRTICFKCSDMTYEKLESS